jgi:hypothetical protein
MDLHKVDGSERRLTLLGEEGPVRSAGVQLRVGSPTVRGKPTPGTEINRGVLAEALFISVEPQYKKVILHWN